MFDMYQSPIEISQIQEGLNIAFEDGVFKAIRRVGINVDKEELLKALAYDRGQYEQGYRDALKGQPHWISVKDSLPKDQKPVIVYVPSHTNRYGDEFIGYVGMAYYTYSVNGGYWCGTDGEVYGAIGMIATPSHWMPLPEPPEVKQDG